VVDLLVAHGAHVDARLGPDGGDTALSVVLSCAQRRALQLAPTPPPPPPLAPDLSVGDLSSVSVSDSGGPFSFSSAGARVVASASHGGRCFWVPVAHVLVERGASWWPPARMDPLGRTMLHLLFAGPAPPPKDAPLFARLISSALHSGLHVCAHQRDARGDTPASLALKQARGPIERAALRDVFAKHGVKLSRDDAAAPSAEFWG
jgi:hypothetical protein